MQACATTQRRARPAGTTTWVHVSDAISELLDMLMAEAETAIEQHGGFRGPVRPRQRPWSRMLDEIQAEREGAAA